MSRAHPSPACLAPRLHVFPVLPPHAASSLRGAPLIVFALVALLLLAPASGRYVLSINGANSFSPPCPVGFYASALTCAPCTAGLTSPAGASSNASCYLGDTALAGATCVSTVVGGQPVTAVADGIGDPNAITFWNGIVVFSDSGLVRMIQASGALQTLVGGGTLIFDHGIATTYAYGNSWDMTPARTDAGTLYLIIGQIVAAYKDGYITRIAGDARVTATALSLGDGGPALAATFMRPFSLIADEHDNLFVADDGNWAVPLGVLRRIVRSTGIITTLISNLDLPWAMAYGPDLHLHILFTGGMGGVYRVDQLNLATISNASITKVFGPSRSSPRPEGTGDGGPLIDALFNSVRDMAFASNGDLILGDGGSGALRRVPYSSTSPKGNYTSGVITSFVGCCGGRSSSGDGGPAINATLNNFYRFVITPAGDIYVADTDNKAIRHITPDGIIRTAAGNSKMIPPRTLPVTTATLSGLGGLSLASNGLLYIISDYVLRSMNFSSGILTQIAGQVGKSGYFGDGDFAENAIFANPLRPLALLNGDVIVADSRNNRVRYVNTTSGIITAFIGIKGEFGYDISNEGKPALEGLLHHPSGVAQDSRGDYFVADNWNSKIRRVSNGRIFLFAGHATISPEGRNDRNYPGIVDDGRPANNTLLFNPSSVLLDDADNLIIANAGHHTIRIVNRTTGLIYTLAGRHAVSGNEGNGGLAVSALLNNPQGLALHRSTGNIFIADTGNNAIRVILGATGIIMLVGGDATGSKGYFDSTNNLFSRFDYPYDIAISPEGALFVADNNNNAVRHLPFSAPTTCPAGFFCSCGLNLAPCTSASSFCPVNSKAPVTVSPGFFAISTTPLAAAGDATIMYTSQRMCPVGFYCAAGVAIPCRAGTYGIALLQSVAASCFKCAPGTYLAESGLALLNSSSPCIPCPPGSWAGAAGGRFCPFCAPGFFSNASSCTPCPAGTSSGYGASRCFPYSANDRAAASRDAFTYSRILPVDSGNKDSSTLLLAGMSPFLLLVAVSYIMLSLSRARCAPLWVVVLLKRVDMFNIEGPRTKGDSPKYRPTSTGGFWTVFGVSAVAYLAFSSLVQFYTSNIQLQRSELTVNALSLSSFGDLSPILTALSSPPPPMTVVAGFRIEVATMGRQCHNMSATTDSLNGNFTYTLLPAENGAYTHRFDCTGCVASALTFFLAVFPPTCQSFLVRLSAIDGGGSATVSEFVASNAGLGDALLSSVTATVPLQIEILQDLVAGAPRASDGLVVAGRSAIGYKVAAPQNILLATDGSIDDRAGSVALRLNLPLQNSYTVYTFVPLMTMLTLVSTMAAWLGIFPFFGVAKDFISGIGKASSTVGRVWSQRTVVEKKLADGAAGEGAPSAPQQPSVALGGASAGATRDGIDGGGAALQYERGQRESLPAGSEVWGGAPAAAVAETKPRSPGEAAAVTPAPAPPLSTGVFAALGYIFSCVCKASARSAAVRPTTVPSP